MQSHGEASLVIDAPAERLWEMVSDVTQMGRWSPECYRCTWVGGATGPEVGARFRGYNRRGWVRWVTTSTVVESVPGKVFAFDTGASRTRWTYRFEPQADGTTLVTESRDDTGPRPLPARVVSKLLMGPDHDAELVEGMHQTLERLRAAAE
jgi:dimethylaniline monooxygenase (N-oxide forming)